MQCATCGRELTSSVFSSGVCPSCGAPVSAATPAPANDLPDPVGTTAPMAPTTPITLDAITSQAYPTGYQPPHPADVPPPVTPPPARRGGSGALIGILAVVVIVVLLGGLALLGRNGSGPLAALAAPTATAVPTATPLPPTPSSTAAPTLPVPAPGPGFTTFIAPDGSYGLNYPIDWVPAQQSASGITAQAFVSTDFANIFLVVPLTQTVPPSQYATIAEQVGQAAGVKDIKVTAGPTKVTLGATTWNKVTGTLSLNGKPYDSTILGTDRSAGTFLLVYLAPPATFASVEQTDFLPMATSITFGS